jgi:hypothetical protein
MKGVMMAAEAQQMKAVAKEWRQLMGASKLDLVWKTLRAMLNTFEVCQRNLNQVLNV